MENKITSMVLEISPSIATEMLKKNTRNRPMRANTVIRYATDMAEGRWQMNGEAIIIASDDSLLDGQHRLRACVASGVSFRSVVTRGVNPEAFRTLGQGRGRTFVDILALNGEEHPEILSSAIRWLFWWNHGRSSMAMKGSTRSGGSTRKGGHKPRSSNLQPSKLAQTAGALQVELDACPQVRQGVKFAAANKSLFRGVAPIGLVAFHHTKAMQTAPEHQPGEFWLDVGGVDLAALRHGDPALALRAAGMRGGQEMGTYFLHRALAPASIRAWNAHCKGEKLDHIKLLTDAEAPEFYVAE